MAFELRHWMGAALAGCTLLAVLELPPEIIVGRGEAAVPLPEEARYRALVGDVTRSRELLSRLRWSDSLSSVLVSSAADGWLVGVEGDGVSPGALERFRSNVEREVSAIPDRREDVLLGVFVQSNRRSEHPDVQGIPSGGNRWPEFYLGQRAGRGFCFTVQPTVGMPADGNLNWAPWSPVGEVRRGNTLGPCFWVAALGMPSAAMSRWLEEGGHLFGAEPPGRASRPAAHPVYLQRLFGIRFMSWGASLTRERCLAGIAEACATIFAGPLERRGSLDDVVLETAYIGRWAGLNWGYESWQWILGDLQAEFGSDRLRAFWTAETDPLTAFRGAFGVDAGQWMATWTQENLGASPPGPAPTRSAFFGGLLFVILGAGLAMGAARGRTLSA